MKNDEMGKTISSSSSRRFSSSPKVEKTFLQGMKAIRLSRWFIHRKRIRLLPPSQIPKTKTMDSRVEGVGNGITTSKEEMTIVKRMNKGVMRHPRIIVV